MSPYQASDLRFSPHLLPDDCSRLLKSPDPGNSIRIESYYGSGFRRSRSLKAGRTPLGLPGQGFRAWGSRITAWRAFGFKSSVVKARANILIVCIVQLIKDKPLEPTECYNLGKCSSATPCESVIWPSIMVVFLLK